MVLSKILIGEKCTRIRTYLGEIKPLLRLSKQEILKDVFKLRTLERNFQLIMDEIIDINQYLIKERDLEVPDDFQGSFRVLAKHNILPRVFAERLAPAVGLRNRIVHRYEELNPKLFIESFQKDYPDFEQYLKYINQYLDRNLTRPKKRNTINNA